MTVELNRPVFRMFHDTSRQSLFLLTTRAGPIVSLFYPPSPPSPRLLRFFRLACLELTNSLSFVVFLNIVRVLSENFCRTTI